MTRMIAALVLFAALATAPALAETAKDTAGLVPVRLATIGSAGQGELAFAVRKYGLDRKYGFDLKEVDYAAPGQQYTILRSGAADVTAGNFVDLLRQRNAHNGLRAFHGFQRFSMLIVVKADSPVKAMTDLKGKKMGEFGTTFLDWLIIRSAASKAYGIDIEKDATPVQGAPPLLNQFLAKGDVDATLQFPQLTLAPILHGEQRVLANEPDLMKQAGFNPDCLYLQWFVSDAWMGANGATIGKLYAMFDEGYAKLMSDDAMWPSLAQRVGITDPALIERFKQISRTIDNPPYEPSLLAPTQALLDSITAVVGDGLGILKLDPAAFIFPNH